MHFICGVTAIEDVVPVPGRPLLIGGSYGPPPRPQPLVVLDPVSLSWSPLDTQWPDRPQPPYQACPTPMRAALLSPHGLGIEIAPDGRGTLYVVNHGSRESIEVFSIDGRGSRVSARWIGCVVMPEGAVGNAVAALPGGGFVATKYYDDRDGPWRTQFRARRATSAVYRWRPGRGFDRVPGGEAVADNGIEVSTDGRWVFVVSWVEKKVIRLALDGSAPPQSIPLDFMADNIHRLPDGAMLLSGQIADIDILSSCKRARCPVDWAIARLDPATLRVAYLLWEKGTPAFADASGGYPVGDRLVVSPFRGDRVAVMPMPTTALDGK